MRDQYTPTNTVVLSGVVVSYIDSFCGCSLALGSNPAGVFFVGY